MQALYLLELDSFEHKGKWYTVGHSVVFKAREDIEYFVNNSHIEKKEYVIKSMPFLFGLFGGTSVTKKEIREVYCLNKKEESAEWIGKTCPKCCSLVMTQKPRKSNFCEICGTELLLSEKQ